MNLNASNGRRLGCWLERMVRRICPRLTMTRAESLAAMAGLQCKLNQQREETKQWRARCLKVEQLYIDNLHAMREAAREHDGLSWRVM